MVFGFSKTGTKINKSLTVCINVFIIGYEGMA